MVGLINQLDSNLVLGMRKRAEISILAGVNIIPVRLAELALVSTGMVQLLNFVVRFLAIAILFVARDMRIGLEIRPSLVLIIMVVETHLALVGF